MVALSGRDDRTDGVAAVRSLTPPSGRMSSRPLSATLTNDDCSSRSGSGGQPHAVDAVALRGREPEAGPGRSPSPWLVSQQAAVASRPLSAIEEPELRLAFMAAHRAWAKATCPWLLEEWIA